MLQRYRLTRGGQAATEAGPNANPQAGPDWSIEEITPVDDRFDTRMRMGLGSLEIRPITPHP